jgi:hypothetical protein
MSPVSKSTDALRKLNALQALIFLEPLTAIHVAVTPEL